MQTKLTFLPGDSPANPTQPQVKDLGKMTSDISGRACLGQLKKLNQVGSWAKMFTELLIGQGDWSSTRCKLTWKMKGTKYNRIYFQLAPKTLPTAEIESGLLLTPTAVMTDEHPDAMRARAKKNGYKNGTMYGSLLSQVKYSGLFPTPTSVQRDHPERVEKLKATGAKTMMSRKAGENRPNSILDAAMFTGMIPTPTARDYKDTFKSQEKLNNQYKKRMGPGIALTVGYKTGSTSQLNPRFVAEMMGFPPDWTELPFQSGEMNQSKAMEMP